MPLPKLPSARTRILLSILAVGAIAIGFMAVTIFGDLRSMRTASTENVQWTLSQTEVEFIEYELDLVTALRQETPDLDMLRQKFDIFYSRINMLGQAKIYAELHGLPIFSRNFSVVRSFLDRSVEFIDASDPDLFAGLSTLADEAERVRLNVRMMSNAGLIYFAEDADRRRNNISVTLTQMAALVTCLLVTLILLAVYLNHLNALNIRRRREAVEAAERVNVVTGTSLDAVVVSDLDGRILDFNAAAETIFGYQADQVAGLELIELIVPDADLQEHRDGMRRLRETGETRFVGRGRFKMEAKRADGEIFPIEFAVQSATTHEGDIFVTFIRDISHRVKAEQETMAARDRALAGEKAKTDFLATMSHEIRTPLNGLLGNLSLLTDTDMNDDQQRYVKNMETSGKLLMSHISDVLDITKYDAGKLRLHPEAMNVNTLLQDLIDNQSAGAVANDTTLTWSWIGAPTDWIFADRSRIQHILINVIGNAVKFTRGGHVAVEAEVIHKENLLSELSVRVTDTGIGMDAQLQSQIFDDFMTGDTSYDRDVEGTGLGLGIALRFVKALGGGIDVSSAPGRGSTFIVHFPIEPIKAPDVLEEPAQDYSALPPCDVLLVEDNEINRIVAREMLTKAGHTVTVAENGQIAVEKAQTHRFDLIFMDISMPVLDGRGATRAIRSGQGACANVPIVALTANIVAEEQEAFLQDGMNDILPKPLTKEGLFQVIADYVVPTSASITPSPEPSTVVASTYLAELRDTIGAEALAPVLDRFVVEIDELLDYMHDHAAHPLAEVGATAHRTAGSAATFGAVDLRAALVEIEQAAKVEDRRGIASVVVRLPKIWQATRPFMHA